ncbi:MAG: signaling recognition particle receptor family protein, partial [Oscillibacter sp.]
MGFFDKIKKITTNLFSGFSEADEAFFEELEETLILADLGMDTAVEAVEQLRQRVRREKLHDQEDVKIALREILAAMMTVGDTALDLSAAPSVVLVIGVNGVGKTTSIGKLGYQLKGEGRRVLLCAADTFRAAAADQLEIWAERAGCELVRQNEGADPGAVLFDALRAAQARNVDVVLCDTAGRLHNKTNLMNELAKLSKIIDREAPEASRETLLVLDATTGQNGLVQAKLFQE